MADTLIDKPATETLPDIDPAFAHHGATGPVQGAPPEPAGPRPPAPKRGPMLVIVASVLAVLAVLAGAAAFYLLVWRYEPTAKKHIPGNATVAVRLEASDILLFGPVRKHLWPLLEEPPSSAPPSPKPAGKSRIDRIKEETGVNLSRDLREIVVASVDAQSWVLAAGGNIPKGRFVKGLDKVLREEHASGWSLSGDLLIGPNVTIGQAEDGTLIVGTDVRIVNAALPASEEHRSLGLPDGGAVSFAITHDAWSGAAGVLRAMPRGAVFGKVDRASGTMTLGDKPRLDMRLEPMQGTDPAALSGDVDGMLTDLRLILLLAPDVAGEKEAIAGTKLEAKGGVVLVTTPWPYDGLDRGAATLAKIIRFGRAEPQPTLKLPGLPF